MLYIAHDWNISRGLPSCHPGYTEAEDQTSPWLRSPTRGLTSRSQTRSSTRRWAVPHCPQRTYSPGVTTWRRWQHGWSWGWPRWASRPHLSGSTRRHCGQRRRSQYGRSSGPSRCLGRTGTGESTRGCQGHASLTLTIFQGPHIVLWMKTNKPLRNMRFKKNTKLFDVRMWLTWEWNRPSGGSPDRAPKIWL